MRTRREGLETKRLVFMLLCEYGFANKEIAARVDRSEAQVKAIIGEAVKAAGLQNRTQLVIQYWQQQVVLTTMEGAA